MQASKCKAFAVHIQMARDDAEKCARMDDIETSIKELLRCVDLRCQSLRFDGGLMRDMIDLREQMAHTYVELRSGSE